MSVADIYSAVDILSVMPEGSVLSVGQIAYSIARRYGTDANVPKTERSLRAARLRRTGLGYVNGKPNVVVLEDCSKVIEENGKETVGGDGEEVHSSSYHAD